MSEDIEIECPECGRTEEAAVGPTLALNAELDVTVRSVECWECGHGLEDDD